MMRTWDDHVPPPADGGTVKHSATRSPWSSFSARRMLAFTGTT